MLTETEQPAAGIAVTLAAPEPAVLRQRVLRMAWPVIGQNVLETLLGMAHEHGMQKEEHDTRN